MRRKLAAAAVFVILSVGGGVHAQVPSYMPAVIGATVGNAVARGQACAEGNKIPDQFIQQWSPMLDERMAGYEKAMADADGSAARKLFIRRAEGGLYGRDGQVHEASSVKKAFAPGETHELRKLTMVQTIFGGDFQSARGVWKVEGAEGEPRPVLVADFQRDFWGAWKIWRLREFTAEEAPSAPEPYCFAGELTKLW